MGDFQQYEGLISTQGGHFSDLSHFCSSQWAISDGLDGLLYLVRPFVSESAQFFEEKIAQCGRGMNLVEGKVKQTAADYAGTDQDIAVGLRKLYPTPLPGFPDLGAMNLPHLGNKQLKASASVDDLRPVIDQLRTTVVDHARRSDAAYSARRRG